MLKTLFFLLLCALAVPAEGAEPEQVRQLRLAGQLKAAQTLAEQGLADDATSQSQRFHLHLELARIHDRYGLHFRSRPVAAALLEIERAAALAEELDQYHQALLKLARGFYFYRAEMAERQFPQASMLAATAIEQFFHLGDFHSQAYAVHLRGLIHLQRGEFEAARQDFDRSLELDRQGGAREYFRGEYERHVAFVYIRQGEIEAAIPYLERSLAARRNSGAIDASLFAANTLAGQLLALGEVERVPALLKYAAQVLEDLDSPHGGYWNAMNNGRYWLAVGKADRAEPYLRAARRLAESIAWQDGARQAGEFLGSE